MAEPKPSPSPSRSQAVLWSVRRVWAVALVTFRQGMRMWLWVLAPLAIAVIVVADLSAPRFDPIFDAIPAALGTTLLVMAVVAALVAIFFATYSLPTDIYTRVAYTLTTKPIRRWEIVLGKTAGMGVLMAVILGLIGAGAYGYMRVRSVEVRGLAESRLAEAPGRGAHEADLNAVRRVLQAGPMRFHRYVAAAEGPEVQIDFGAAGRPPSAATWSLAADGMKLLWDVRELPVADWLAAGPGLLRLRLKLRPPPGVERRPAAVSVRIVPDLTPEQSRQFESDEFRERFTAQRQMPEDGVLELPLYAEGFAEASGGLPLPGDVPFRVEVALIAPRDELSGFLLGAGGRSLEVVRAGGERIALPDGPEAVAQGTRGRLWIAGRPTPPRQVALLRLGGVSAGVLGEGPAAVEFTGGLDSMSPATVETTAEVTFVNPSTGGRQAPVPFTPEPHRASILYVDAELWRGRGPLEVHVACRTQGDLIGVRRDSVHLRLGAGPFAWNLLKAMTAVWLFGMVTASVGVAMSTRMSWFVAMFATIGFFIVAALKDFILTSTPVRFLVRMMVRWLAERWEGVDWMALIELSPLPLPDLTVLLPPESVQQGVALSIGHLGWQMVYAGVWVGLAFLVGVLLYRGREIAA